MSLFFIFKCRPAFLGENLYSSKALLLEDFPATATPSELYAHFEFNIN